MKRLFCGGPASPNSTFDLLVHGEFGAKELRNTIRQLQLLAEFLEGDEPSDPVVKWETIS